MIWEQPRSYFCTQWHFKQIFNQSNDAQHLAVWFALSLLSWINAFVFVSLCQSNVAAVCLNLHFLRACSYVKSVPWATFVLEMSRIIWFHGGWGMCSLPAVLDGNAVLESNYSIVGLSWYVWVLIFSVAAVVAVVLLYIPFIRGVQLRK